MVHPICACSNVTVISDVLKIHAAIEYGHKEEGRPVMVKRKLDGAVDKSSADQKCISRTQLYITCEKSGGLRLAEPGLTAGWLADKFGRGLKF